MIANVTNMYILNSQKVAIHKQIIIIGYYKLFTFLSVDMEILTPWSSQVHLEVQPKYVQGTEGYSILHIYGQERR